MASLAPKNCAVQLPLSVSPINLFSQHVHLFFFSQDQMNFGQSLCLDTSPVTVFVFVFFVFFLLVCFVFTLTAKFSGMKQGQTGIQSAAN